MLTFRKILCPTDFSEPSLTAIKAANSLAPSFDSEILLLHVYKPVPQMPMSGIANPETTFDISDYEEILAKHAHASLATIAESVIDDGVNARTIVRMGKPAQEILAVAHEEQVDAIFMATRGHTGLKHLVFGSEAEKVVRQAECPVLTFNTYEHGR